jgi:hypothetical protein
VTDLSELQEDLHEFGHAPDSGKETYLFRFSDPEAYEIEYECFEEVAQRNPKRFLGDLAGLKKEFSFVGVLVRWEAKFESVEHWESTLDYPILHKNRSLAGKLVEKGLVEVEFGSDRMEVGEYLSDKTVAELKEIAKRHSVKVSGKKADIMATLSDALKAHDAFIDAEVEQFRPGPEFQAWVDALQVKYVDMVESSLATFEYPENYLRCVWHWLVLDHIGYPMVLQTIRERHAEMLEDVSRQTLVTEHDATDLGNGTLQISTEHQEYTHFEDSGNDRFRPHDAKPIPSTELHFTYINDEEEAERRAVDAVHVWEHDGHVYFDGLCRKRLANRIFRLDRVHGDITNHVTGKSAEVHTLPALLELVGAKRSKAVKHKESKKQKRQKARLQVPRQRSIFRLVVVLFGIILLYVFYLILRDL